MNSAAVPRYITRVLNAVIGAVVVLVYSLEPPDVVVRVRHQVHVQNGAVGGPYTAGPARFVVYCSERVPPRGSASTNSKGGALCGAGTAAAAHAPTHAPPTISGARGSFMAVTPRRGVTTAANPET